MEEEEEEEEKKEEERIRQKVCTFVFVKNIYFCF
jgi:hypothetical protein